MHKTERIWIDRDELPPRVSPRQYIVLKREGYFDVAAEDVARVNALRVHDGLLFERRDASEAWRFVVAVPVPLARRLSARSPAPRGEYGTLRASARGRTWVTRGELPASLEERHYLVYGEFGRFRIGPDDLASLAPLAPQDAVLFQWRDEGPHLVTQADWNVVGTSLHKVPAPPPSLGLPHVHREGMAR